MVLFNIDLFTFNTKYMLSKRQYSAIVCQIDLATKLPVTFIKLKPDNQ